MDTEEVRLFLPLLLIQSLVGALSCSEAKSAGATPRRGGRPAAPAPPVEVTATELAALKKTLEDNTVELQKSQVALKVRAQRSHRVFVRRCQQSAPR